MDDQQAYAEASAELDTLLADVGALLVDLTDGSEGEGQEEALLTRLDSWFQAFSSLRERHANAQLSVACLALIKSGALGLRWGAPAACCARSRARLRLDASQVASYRPGKGCYVPVRARGTPAPIHATSGGAQDDAWIYMHLALPPQASPPCSTP